MSRGADTRRAIKQTYRTAFKGGGTVTCRLCGKPIRFFSDLTIDHLLPKSKGGTNSINNLAPAHYLCNQRKASNLIAELVYEDAPIESKE